MGLIKTVNEAVRDRMNECVDKLVKKYMKSVRPIYGSTKHGKPYHIGSCILIQVNNNKYLITAAHVIDHNQVTTIYVSGQNALIQIEGECYITSKVDKDRNKDRYDFSMLKLSQEIIGKLDDVVFLCSSDFMLNLRSNARGLFLALGFPNSKNKKFYYQTKKVTQNPFVYSSTLKKEKKDFKAVRVQESDHFLLDFDSKHSKDSDGNIVNSVSPTGASGGGLFYLENMTSPESFRPSAECKGKLVGLLIENIKEHRTIVATRLSMILNALTNQSRGT